MNDEIEMGFTIVGRLYLHIEPNNQPTAFDIKNIEEVVEENGITIVNYKTHSTSETIPFVVSESKKDIDEKLKEAHYYRDEALKFIEKLAGS